MNDAKKSQNNQQQDEPFIHVLTQALENFRQPQWLGENSPLASPYFLGSYLNAETTVDRNDIVYRGQALQNLLENAVRQFPEQSPYDQWGRLLSTYFVPEKLFVALRDVGMSKSDYYRKRAPAIKYLADEIIRLHQPALRLETPLQVKWKLMGRDEVEEVGLEALKDSKILAITGAGGIGKSTFGTVLARRFAPSNVFWFTFRPQLNDQLYSVLFALAYFLSKRGAATLWRHLLDDIADNDKKERLHQEKMMSILRDDLRHLKTKEESTDFVLCFDEVDLLEQVGHESHIQIIGFLESLRDLVPLIIISQKAIIMADHHVDLNGLSETQIGQMLDWLNISYVEGDLNTLYQFTQGNPRLLVLYTVYYQTLARTKEPVSQALERLTNQPSLEAAIIRIWGRLEIEEQYILQVLSIYRRPIPPEVFIEGATQDERQAALTQLKNWDLVQEDYQGGVSLLPAYRDTIQNRILSEKGEIKKNLHLLGARARSNLRQYTAAAHHYAAGGMYQESIWLLYQNWRTEVDQGQASAILTFIKADIPFEQLTERQDQEALNILQIEVRKLLGHYEEAQQILQTSRWRTPMMQAYAKRLEGDIAELKTQTQQAIQSYSEGLRITEKLLENRANFLSDIGHAYINSGDLTAAEHHLYLIQYEAEHLAANIEARRDQIDLAREHYSKAFELAQEIGEPYRQANSGMQLGVQLARIGDAQAVQYLKPAIVYFRRVNNLHKLGQSLVNLAMFYTLTEDYKQAIPQLHEAFDLFSDLQEPQSLAAAAQNLAEAHLALNNLKEAEHYAHQVIETEDEHTFPDGIRTLGEVRLDQGKFQEATQYIVQSIEICQGSQKEYLEGYGWRALMKVHCAQDERLEAETAKNRAIECFEASGATMEIERTVNDWQDKCGRLN